MFSPLTAPGYPAVFCILDNFLPLLANIANRSLRKAVQRVWIFRTQGENTLTEPQTVDVGDLQLEQVDSLVEAAGEDGALAILDAFQRSTADLTNALEVDIQKGALEEASRTAHAIKGSAANVGAVAIAEAASVIENACKTEDNTTALEYFLKIKPLHDSFQVAFKSRIERS